MTRFLKNLNFSSVFIMLVGSFLCYQQTRILTQVDQIPKMQQEIVTLRDEVKEARRELDEERKERKEGDREKDMRLRLMENKVGRMP